MADKNSMSGFVLLAQCAMNWDEFRLQFFDDWKVEIEGACDENELQFTINGVRVDCMLMEGQIEEAIENADKNYAWVGAKEVISAHKAFVHLYLSDCENALQRHVLFSMIAGSLLKMPGAIGLYQYPITRHAEDYVLDVERMQNDELPVLSWIYIGLYQDEDGLWNSYTYGLEEFDRDEIEVLHCKLGLVELYQFMAQLITYLISTGSRVEDGLPFEGEMAEQITITKSEAEAFNGESLKISLSL